MSAYDQFRMALIQRILDEKLTPNQVAEVLESEGFGTLCWDEIAEYRKRGDHWLSDDEPMRWCPRCHHLHNLTLQCMVLL